jgi:hypothetical protein
MIRPSVINVCADLIRCVAGAKRREGKSIEHCDTKPKGWIQENTKASDSPKSDAFEFLFLVEGMFVRDNIGESGRREVAGALRVYCASVAPAAHHAGDAGARVEPTCGLRRYSQFVAVPKRRRLKVMSIKLILVFIVVGLVCYLLGRLSGRRGDDGSRPMLQTSAPRTLGAAQAASAAATHAGTLDAASLEEIKRLVRERQLIAAIRIYRERTDCGLREAKEAVESIAESL